jgi:hypothetical protein
MTDNDKEWMTPLTKFLIEERWSAYRRRQWEKYNHLKIKVRNEIKRAKLIWANKMKKSTNGLWKLVNNIRGNVNRDPLNDLITEYDSADGLLHQLQTKLSEGFAADPTAVTESLSSVGNDDWNIEITEYAVRSLLSRIPPSKAPGHDGIPSKIYRCLADIIAFPLSVIFKNSISKRTVPLAWKKGVIIPIPKTKPASIGKLRFITLLPVPLKILERLVLRSVWRNFEDAYGSEQHGFRPRASTSTALLRLMDAALACLNDSSLFGLALVSFDLSRAFDTIDCTLTVQKMRNFGFPGGFLRWLQSYFHNRSGVIKVRDRTSQEFVLSRGVPQGSVLGPAIFCVYVSNMKGVSSDVTTVKYADDINLIIPLRSRDPKEIKDLVDSEVNHISALCSSDRLTLNLDKSKVLFATRRELHFVDPPCLPIVNTMKLLGFVINDKLNWSSHIEYVCKKSAQRLHVLRVLRELIPAADLHLVYSSLIRSLLEYASPVFVGLNKKLSKKLQNIEKRAHKIMAGFLDRPYRSCTCKMNNLCERRIVTAEKLFTIIDECPFHPLHSCLPRRLMKTKRFSVPLAYSDKYHNSFFPFMARHLNNK